MQNLSLQKWSKLVSLKNNIRNLTLYPWKSPYHTAIRSYSIKALKRGQKYETPKARE